MTAPAASAQDRPLRKTPGAVSAECPRPGSPIPRVTGRRDVMRATVSQTCNDLTGQDAATGEVSAGGRGAGAAAA